MLEWQYSVIKVGVAYMIEEFKKELAWVIDKFQVTSNKMLFKIVILLDN